MFNEYLNEESIAKNNYQFFCNSSITKKYVVIDAKKVKKL